MFAHSGRENFKIALKDSGTILFYSAISFFVPIVLSIILDKDQTNLFFYSISALGLFFIGFLLKNIKTIRKETENKHAMISIVIIWFIYCLFASLPFIFIMNVSPIDAYFESMSSLTTTGLSVMNPLLDDMPLSLIFWRSFIGWVGGIGIVLLALIGIVTTYSKSIKLLTAEGRGEQLKETLKISIGKISAIYLFLTLLGAALLFFAGQTPWEAINYSMSAISTNGVNITSAGLTQVNNGWLPIGVNNYWVSLILIILMIFGATSFSLHYLFLRKKNWFVYFKDPEFKLLILLGLIGTVIVATKLGLLNSFFHTFSALTTGGFLIVEAQTVSLWEDFVKFLWFPLLIIGGAAGSTAGGIKISRFIIFIKGIFWKIKSQMLPEKSYFRRYYNGEVITPSQVKEINQFILIWIGFILISTLIISAYGYQLSDVLFEVASAQSNSGVTAGISSPQAPTLVKLVLIINMFIGRLEIIPIIIGVSLLLNLRQR